MWGWKPANYSPQSTLPVAFLLSSTGGRHGQVIGNSDEGRSHFFPPVFWQEHLVAEATGQSELRILTQATRLWWQWQWVFKQALVPEAPEAALAEGGPRQPQRPTLLVLGDIVSPFTPLVLGMVVIPCSYWSLGKLTSTGSCRSSNIFVTHFLY